MENRPVVSKGEGRGCGMAWEFGVGRCKLLHFKWMSNEALLYITGNYIQYVHIHAWVTLLYTGNWHNIVNPLYFNLKIKLNMEEKKEYFYHGVHHD